MRLQSTHPRRRSILRRTASLAAALIVVLSGCAEPAEELPFFESQDLTPIWKASSSATHRVSAFAFEDQSRESVSDESLSGSVWVASFFFTRCNGICPTLRNRLATVQQALGSDPGFGLVSFSVDPGHDGIDILGAYARMNAVNPDTWSLVTGDSRDITRLADKSFFVAGTKETGFVHTENVYLVDQAGRIRGVYNGTQTLDIDRLIEDAALLLNAS